MADFAFIEEPSGSGPVIINLDYVTRIYTGLDPKEPTEVTFRDGTNMIMSRSEGTKLIAQLNLCCRPRPEQSSIQVPGQPTQQAARRSAAKSGAKRRSARSAR